MSRWITLTIDDLNDAKVAALVNALRNAALGSGQDDPVPELISSVTTRIRAEVAGCSRNLIDQDTTKIPASLKLLASRMVIVAAKNRLEMPLKEDERSQLRSDERYLERIAQCAVPIEDPDTPITAPVQQSGGVTLVSSRPKKHKGSQLKGL